MKNGNRKNKSAKFKREASRYREPPVINGFRPMLTRISFPGNSDDT